MKNIKDILDEQDQEFLKLVEAHKGVGFGRMMALISARWKQDSPTGAFTVGTCYGLKPRHEIEWFAIDMEAKLKFNDHKGGWQDCSIDYLYKRLIEETDELINAVMNGQNIDSVTAEAADVANFAMMIQDIYKRRNTD